MQFDPRASDEYKTASITYEAFLKDIRKSGVHPDSAAVAAAQLTNAVILARLAKNGLDVTTQH